jgi:hypothetical protein
MATQRLAANLSSSIVNQDDPVTVQAAIPSYLLLMEGMLRDEPDNPNLLLSTSRLYAAYAASLENQPMRSRNLYAHAKTFARNALCLKQPAVCAAEQQDFVAFKAALAGFASADMDLLYAYACRYADWIASTREDWSSLMLLPYAEAMMQTVVNTLPGHDYGRAQLYLAVIKSQLPASLGGKPELGRQHFELALDFSRGRDLMIKVKFAQTYARLVFDQKLHDALLNEVLQSDPVVEGYTLSNVLAQREAKRLLNDGYF